MPVDRDRRVHAVPRVGSLQRRRGPRRRQLRRRTPSRASNSPPAADFWFVAEFADDAAHEQWSDRVKAAIRLLADSGFGGERSRGWGRSRDAGLPRQSRRC